MGQYTIPTVVERTSLGERAFDIYSRLLSVDYGLADQVITTRNEARAELASA